MTKPKAPEDLLPRGRPTDYDPAFCEEMVAFCADGYSLTAFAGKIGHGRQSITDWAKVHPEFSLAVHRAKAACALWWEDRGRGVAQEGGPGGQATMVIFGLKNHAPDDYRDKTEIEHAGKDGGPIVQRIERIIVDAPNTDSAGICPIVEAGEA